MNEELLARAFEAGYQCGLSAVQWNDPKREFRRYMFNEWVKTQ